MVDDMSIMNYQGTIAGVALAARLLVNAPMSVRDMLEAIREAEAVGPMLDPTLYKAKAQAMAEDKALLEAALPLYDFARRHFQDPGSGPT